MLRGIGIKEIRNENVFVIYIYMHTKRGGIVVPPNGNISSFGTKTSRPGKSQGQDAKILLRLTRGNKEWSHSYFYPLIAGYMPIGSGRNGTIDWMLI